MKEKESKKTEKILTVPMIKNAIRSGHTYCNDLAKLFKCSKQRMYYWLKKMRKDNIIEVDVEEGKGKVAIYYKVVEPMVKTRSKQLSIGDCIGQKQGQKMYFEDNAYVSYGIIEYDKYFVPENDWMAGKTLMKGFHIGKCWIRIANDKTISFIFPKVYGNTSKEAHNNLIAMSTEVKSKFLKMYPNFKLTKFPVNEGYGSLGTTKLKDAIAEIKPKLPIKTDEYEIDATPEEGSFEMKVKDKPLVTAEKLEKTITTITSGRLDRIENAMDKLAKVLILSQEPKIQKLLKLVDSVPNLEKLIELLEKSKKRKEDLNYVG